MFHTLNIDPLIYARNLKGAGISEAGANAIAEAFTGGERFDFASKGDVREVRDELKADIAQVRNEIAEVKADIADVKADLKWMRIIGSVGFALICYPILKDILHFATQ